MSQVELCDCGELNSECICIENVQDDTSSNDEIDREIAKQKFKEGFMQFVQDKTNRLEYSIAFASIVDLIVTEYNNEQSTQPFTSQEFIETIKLYHEVFNELVNEFNENSGDPKWN